MRIELGRVYEAGDAAPRCRVLVDRLWPRGVSKESLRLDEWCREVAPSDALRKWFAHDPARWEEYRRRYRDELKARGELLAHLRSLARRRPLLLLFAAKDPQRNQAVVIREALIAKD